MIPEEQLAAYVDGALDDAARAELERVLASDPAATARVAALRARVAQLRAAYAGVLAEPVPERLVAAVRRGGASPTSLDEARARRAARVPRRWAWREWGAVAAAVFLGVIVGERLAMAPAGVPWQSTPGGLVASGPLAAALGTQLAGDPAGGTVRIGISYRAKGGGLCRSFTLASAGGLAGTACHRDGAWILQALAQPSASQPGGDYQLAASGLPPALALLVEGQIEGEPLDAAGEAAARQRGWR